MDEKFAKGFAVGVTLGSISMALGARRSLKLYDREIGKMMKRTWALVEHMIDTMSPYVPVEVLKENLDYMKFDEIIINEEL